MNDSESVVLYETLPTESGHLIGIATLNKPKTLNGLSLDMVQSLDHQLRVWQDDPQIALVVMRGAGDKAFCAGGDLHGIYHAMVAHAGRPGHENHYACDFFAQEYALDYLIHTYSKPIVCWGDGIVMGGGMGLMMGASHRIVTEFSRLAMPEITVGLFPDVGGSWLLSRAPGRTGLFLGLTGLTIHARDAMFCGMADYVMAKDQWPALLDALKHAPWGGSEQARQVTTHAIERVQRQDSVQAMLRALPMGPVRQHFDEINQVCRGFDLEQIVGSILALAQHAEPVFQRAAQNLAQGCPGTARLTWLLYQKVPLLSLAEVFRLEYGVAVECAASGAFAEGIRALLIDKDRNPKWPTPTLAQTAGDWSHPYFAFKTNDPRHPLLNLGL